jgi:hypothetical protein
MVRAAYSRIELPVFIWRNIKLFGGADLPAIENPLPPPMPVSRFAPRRTALEAIAAAQDEPLRWYGLFLDNRIAREPGRAKRTGWDMCTTEAAEQIEVG